MTRCLVKECDTVSLLTFGEGTTQFESSPLCSWLLSSFNRGGGASMFRQIDDRFYKKYNHLDNNKENFKSFSTSGFASSNPNFLNKNWLIKSFKIKYAESDSIYEFYSSIDTINFLNFRNVKVFFNDSSKYLGIDAQGEAVEGIWSFDSVNNKLMTDTTVVEIVSENDNEFTVKGIVPIVKDTSFSTEEYYMTFITSSASETWIGTVNSFWENPGNWNGGFVPDKFTDVIINTGTPYQPIIKSNASVKSLTLQSSGILKIESGFILNIEDRKLSNN